MTATSVPAVTCAHFRYLPAVRPDRSQHVWLFTMTAAVHVPGGVPSGTIEYATPTVMTVD